MKKSLLFLGLVLLSSALFAQQNPVSWSYKAVKVDASQYDLVFTAEMQSGWYVYSQHLEEGGPIPTVFYFNVTEGFEPAGATKEAGDYREEGHDELFDMKVVKFKKKATFTQRIKVTGQVKEITGYLEFMTCNGEQCLPPTNVDFVISL